MNLLHALRQCKRLPVALALWLAMSLGLAVAAPALAPLPDLAVCSAATNSADPSDANPGSHSGGLQCVLCLPLQAAAPAVFSWSVATLATAAPATDRFISANSRPALRLPPQRGPPQA
jgi:hypothetical protein